MNGLMKTYKLYDKGVSKTFLETFLKCREMCRLQYLKGYSPVWDSEAMDFGSAFHACNADLQSRSDKTWAAVQHVCRMYEVNYMKDNGKEMSDGAKERFPEMMSRVAVTLDEYTKFWAKEDVKINWIEREHLFTLWIDYPYDDETMFQIPLLGFRDGVFTPKGKERRIWLFETKTKDRWDESDIRDMLGHDLQTMIYLFALRDQYGSMPAGVRYDLVKRPSSRIKGDAERVRTFIQKDRKSYFWRYNWSTLRKSDLDAWKAKFFDGLLRELVDWTLGFFPDWRRTGGEKEIADPYDNPHHFANSANLVTWWGRDPMFNAVTTGDVTGLVYSARRARKCLIPA